MTVPPAAFSVFVPTSADPGGLESRIDRLNEQQPNRDEEKIYKGGKDLDKEVEYIPLLLGKDATIE